jgi:hypothetical protein
MSKLSTWRCMLQVGQLLPEADIGRIAASGKPQHLVFIAVVGKALTLGNAQIHKSKEVREIHPFQHL